MQNTLRSEYATFAKEVNCFPAAESLRPLMAAMVVLPVSERVFNELNACLNVERNLDFVAEDDPTEEEQTLRFVERLGDILSGQEGFDREEFIQRAISG